MYINRPDTVDFDKCQQINLFCHHRSIEKYTINVDGSIDIFNDHTNLVIVHTHMERLPIKINRITGGFNFSNNYKLTTLMNCPKYIDGNLIINKNTSLPGPVKKFLHENTHNQDNIKTFLMYQDHYDVWTPEFNQGGFNDLILDIEEGLR